jgi:hypothetical protein
MVESSPTAKLTDEGVFQRQGREGMDPDTAKAASGGDYLALDDAALLAQCDVDCYRSSGPGGQKKNKTSSAVRLRHGPTGLIVIAEEDRSQHVNKRRALRRLREAIALHVRAAVSCRTGGRAPTVASCIAADGGIRISRRNPDYYMVVREVLDILAIHAWRVSDAAETLGITTAALVRFLQDDRKVWEGVNQKRESAGLKRLRA